MSLTPVNSFYTGEKFYAFWLFPCDNDTGDKFFAVVIDTAKQFIAGLIDTGDK